jgi:hypothetical protein
MRDDAIEIAQGRGNAQPTPGRVSMGLGAKAP